MAMPIFVMATWLAAPVYGATVVLATDVAATLSAAAKTAVDVDTRVAAPELEPEPVLADAAPAPTVMTLVAYVTIVVLEDAPPTAEDATPLATEDATPLACDEEPACKEAAEDAPEDAVAFTDKSQQVFRITPKRVGNGLGLTHRARATSGEAHSV